MKYAVMIIIISTLFVAGQFPQTTGKILAYIIIRIKCIIMGKPNAQ